MLAEEVLEGTVLELGVGYGGNTCRDIIEAAGLRYFGTDLEKTPAVDFVADFERPEDMKAFSPEAPFGSVLVLNVLEHTFDPIRILDNVISILKPGGKCAVLTPSIWPLHNYPMDTWRVLPNFYEEYARRRGLALDKRFFDYAGHGAVDSFRSTDGNYSYPPPCSHKTRLFCHAPYTSCSTHAGDRCFIQVMLQLALYSKSPWPDSDRADAPLHTSDRGESLVMLRGR